MSSEPRNRTLLVTGASGFLGWNVCREALRQGWAVVGVVNRHAVCPDGATTAVCDITHGTCLRKVLREQRPDAVVHAAALANADYCQDHEEESGRVNRDATVLIGTLCATDGIPCVFTSTDLVFDGRRGNYRPSDPCCPVSVYGRHKAEAEAGLRRAFPDATVCRMPLMFGNPGPAASSFLQPMLRALQVSAPLTLYEDEYRTPVSGAEAARGILRALAWRGETVHLGGRERLSRFEIGRILAAILGADAALILPAPQSSSTRPAPRTRDGSLDSSESFARGYNPPAFGDDLRAVLRDIGALRS